MLMLFSFPSPGAQVLGRLKHLRRRWPRQLGPKHTVPEPARDTEAVLVVGEVVLEVVLLELAVVGWQAAIDVSMAQAWV